MMSSIPSFPPACSNAAISFDLPEGKVVKRFRNMDYVCPLATHYSVFNRDDSYQSCAPGKDLGGYYANGDEGFSWDGQYGFVGMTALGKSNIADGMNEEGFTGGVLTLNATEYQVVPQGENASALAGNDTLKYLFSCCKTIEDAKEALEKVYVWRCTLDNRDKLAFPALHLALHDAEGGNAVVEYVQGKLNFYSNTLGVLTNDPVFPSQCDALKNCVSYTPYFGHELNVNGVVIKGNLVGNGSVGMPGSGSPMDRFARLSLKINQMTKPMDKFDATARMWDLANTTWAMPGSERGTIGKFPWETYTRWSVNMDLTERTITSITYRDRTPKTLKLSDYDFSPGTEHESIPIASAEELKGWQDEYHQCLNALEAEKAKANKDGSGCTVQ